MTRDAYLDFDLNIRRAGQGYRAEAASIGGQAAVEFDLPFSELEIENFLLRLGRPRATTRRIDSPEIQAAKTFGRRLFEAVFADEVRGCLWSSLDEARDRDAGLRIRLRLTEVPELADLPWEYLYSPAVDRFLALSAETPVVRFLDLPERIRPLEVTPPLRVLVMIANPSDYEQLNVEAEWHRLREALGELERAGLVAVERLERATLLELQRRIRKNDYHIFHFIGHGAFDPQSQDGLVLLEDEHGRGRPVSGQHLGTILHEHRPLRLAILNACEGARSSRVDPFAGTAQYLVRQGIPAVVAMQFEITDEAAIVFAREFYGALADGYAVDAAVAEARRAIFSQDNGLEWGTPVLYLRAADGRIFDPRPRVAPPPAPPASPRDTPALEQPVQPGSASGSPPRDERRPRRVTAPQMPRAAGWAAGLALALVLVAAVAYLWVRAQATGSAVAGATVGATVGAPSAAAASASTSSAEGSTAGPSSVLQMGGPPLPVSIKAPGEAPRLLFEGREGRSVSLGLGNVRFAGDSSEATLTIFDPDGKWFTEQRVYMGNSSLDTDTLPSTGRYSLVITPNKPGTVELSLAFSEPIEVSVSTDGTPRSVKTTALGQDVRLSFEGRKWHGISLGFHDVRFGEGSTSAALYISDPEGREILNTSLNPGDSSFDAEPLARDGTYTVSIDPDEAGLIDFTVTASEPVEDGLKVGGPALPVKTTLRGQDARLSFEGREGQAVQLELSEIRYGLGSGAVDVRILSPKAQSIATSRVESDNGTLESGPLPAAGTYYVVLNPDGAGTVELTLTLR